MKLSTRSRYGVRLILELAMNYDKGPVQLNTIAKNQDISEKYLGQLVIQLKSAGVITAVRGKNGGYLLSKEPRNLTLREVIEKLEGDLCLVECMTGAVNCERTDFCITRDIWRELSLRMVEYLDSVTMQDLVDKTFNAKNDNNCIYEI